MRVVLAQINPTIGDLAANALLIERGIATARERGAELVIFPEMSLCGYPPEDFLLLPAFCEAVEAQLQELVQHTHGLAAVIGTVRRVAQGCGEKFLYNSAAICVNGQLIGYHDKMLLPTYDVFDELRYFEPGQEIRVWDIRGKRVAVTICEDIWQHGGAVVHTEYRRDPIHELEGYQPQLLVNLSASPYSYAHHQTRLSICQAAACTLHCPVLLCNQVGGNDSLIFDGNSLYVDAQGRLLSQAKAFAEEFMEVDTDQEGIERKIEPDPTEELFGALVLGLRDYFHKQGFTRAVLGLSGGIDSAVVACLAAEALGPNNVYTVAMPSRYSSPESVPDARTLAQNLGCPFQLISIEAPFESYLDLLTPYFEGKADDTTEENLQSRIRGMILMALSNKHGYIVLATGNKSEMAMGYATLYGDMCGGVGVLSDVTKRQVYALAQWINRASEIIPQNTIDKPPSAELRPNQKDSDSLPDYEMIDTVLEDYVERHRTPEAIAAEHGFPISLVQDLVRRIHVNEYKRRQSAPGLRVSKKAFSVGRRFPIVQKWV